jgi:hypothetical protein
MNCKPSTPLYDKQAYLKPSILNTEIYSTMFYSETSQNRPALGPKIMAGLEGWPVL